VTNTNEIDWANLIGLIWVFESQCRPYIPRIMAMQIGAIHILIKLTHPNITPANETSSQYITPRDLVKSFLDKSYAMYKKANKNGVTIT
tara:strand:+ start:359 stop:625 length:267 start_codon:yes stop_codon:yes gene_type:complete